MTTSEEVRDGLNISPQAKVALVVWEPQTEQMWRKVLPDLLNNYDKLLVFPYGHNALRHFRTYGVANNERILVVDSLNMRVAADDVLTFRIIEDLISNGQAVRVIDPTNRWLSKELSQ